MMVVGVATGEPMGGLDLGVIMDGEFSTLAIGTTLNIGGMIGAGSFLEGGNVRLLIRIIKGLCL